MVREVKHTMLGENHPCSGTFLGVVISSGQMVAMVDFSKGHEHIAQSSVELGFPSKTHEQFVLLVAEEMLAFPVPTALSMGQRNCPSLVHGKVVQNSTVSRFLLQK